MPGSNVVPLAAIQRPHDIEQDVELGVGYVMPGAGWLDWTGGTGTSGGRITLGRDPDAPSSADLIKMGRRDGQARALLSLLTLPIRVSLMRGEWKAPDGEDPENECVTFANDMWTLPPQAGGMSVSRSKFIKQTVLALLHGFSAFEHVRTVPKDGPLAGKVTLRKLAYRDARTVYYLCDDHGGFDGFRQIANFAGRMVDVVVPREKAWYWAANEEENPFYGVSMFEAAFEHYQIKRKLYYISHLASQFAAVPGRLGMLPANPSKGQMEQFRSAIQQFAFNTAMLVPNGYDVKPFNNSTTFNFMQYIDHHNTMMASSVLAKFLQQEDRQVLIDNGKADASADMFVQSLEAMIRDIAESWTTYLLPQYIDYNFNSPVYPVFTPAPLTDEQKSGLVDVFKSLALASTLNCTPEFVRESEKAMSKLFGFDIDYDEIAKREEKQAAEAAAAAQQQGGGDGSTDGTDAPPAGGDGNTGGTPDGSGTPAVSGSPFPWQQGGGNTGAPVSGQPFPWQDQANLSGSLDELIMQLTQLRADEEQNPLGLSDDDTGA